MGTVCNHLRRLLAASALWASETLADQFLWALSPSKNHTQQVKNSVFKRTGLLEAHSACSWLVELIFWC